MADVQLSSLGSVIKTAYEGQADTNNFSDAEKAKLTGIELNATADQTGSEIVAAINSQLGNTTWQTGGSNTPGTMVTKGTWNPSTGSFPSGSLQGDVYEVSGSGTVNLVTFQPGDFIMAKVDNASTTTYAANWTHLGRARKIYPSDLLIGFSKYQVPIDLDSNGVADEIQHGSVPQYELFGKLEVALGGRSVKFSAAVTDPVLSGSTRPRSERRQVNGDGTLAAFSTTSTTNFWQYHGWARVNVVPGTKPDVAFMQLKYADGAQELLLKTQNGNLVLDDQVGGSNTIMTGYTLGSWIEIYCLVGNSQALFHLTLPNGTVFTTTKVVSGTGYFKDGCYTLANGSEGTGFGETEIFMGSGWKEVSASAVVNLINGALGGTSWQTSGGGAVSSVNSQTGAVVLDADDIGVTGTTNKFTTAADISKLAAIEPNATADQTNAEIETAYNAQVAVVSQAVAEAGTSTTVVRWTPQRVAQAIAALATGGGSVLSGAGAPSSTPVAVGRIYIDTTNDVIYISTDTLSSADWKLLLLDTSGTTLTTKATPVAADGLIVFDSAASDAPKLSTITQLITALALTTASNTQTLTNKTLTDPKITLTINAQTGTSYTLVLTDAHKKVTMSNAAANTLNIPLNSSVAFPVGTVLGVTMLGAGATTIDAATGVTLNGINGGAAAISAQYTGVTLTKLATDTWLMEGNHGTVA